MSINDNSFQPHITTKTLNTFDETSENDDQWQKHVSISSEYDRRDEEAHKFALDILFEQGISSDAKHFQVYLNTDGNTKTGFSIKVGEECATNGADYMFEDDKIFKSTSNTKWEWSYVGKIDYKTIKEANNLFRIKLSGNSAKLMSIFDIDNIKNINISIEPVDANWQDTNNFVPEQNITMAVLSGDTGSTGTIDPVPVEPEPIIDPNPIVDPDPIIKPNETVYEDAENAISSNWITVLGQYKPKRRGPGYKDQSKAFVKLKTDWIPLGNDLWENRSEYQLPMNNDKGQNILSVDIVSDGLQMKHYTLGAIVTTEQGERTLQWDSFYNHENLPADKITYDGGRVFITFPLPVELVRGYEYSDINLEENFRVDLEAALEQFEPNNKIISVDTFVATGGNLDNIKLMSK